ncbi:Rv3235 family protein [Mycobacterium sp. CVI_P3]|uniref:Rv3235 family protein n=1 Tax=Mycobacterium pinniadriaticum TaxID=2994102 RepID=A0ABT3SMS9_9MYCO|nr:Rv3235 family protein [Mycobacterium pinniadriaticum]MCX2934408.1 Rv3235 family protein [Mycobacterium pinniadriaticum]MCX2940831.1 Rv3235 family protein [Mycobacterium pinniadriaticum]
MSCVIPVVDYEPPVLQTAPRQTRLLRPRADALPRPPAPRPTRATPMRAAAGFADAALRRVLEVIDRRRPLSQLRPLLAAGLVDSLLPAVTRHEGRGAARLRRLRIQPVDSEGSAAEVAASYSRDDRIHAIACRVEQVATPTGVRWQVVALHIG